MKLITFQLPDGAPRSGMFVDADQRLVDLQAASQARWGEESPLLASVLTIIEGGSNARHPRPQQGQTAGARYEPTSDARFCLLRETPSAGLHFKAGRMLRARQSPDPEAAMCDLEAKGIFVVPQVWYERPVFYHPNRLNVIGNDEDVHWPAYSQLMDFELEFGCYIGKPGKDISKETARDHIFGYTIFNDFSARDEQTKDMLGQLGPGKGKDFDGGNAMGSCLVTADEIDPDHLTMIARVNGEEWGRGNSSDMGWKFGDCIAHVSRSETPVAGEFFGSGTVGNGCGLEHLRFLKSGDVVELEVEGIGVLRNRVLSFGNF